MRRFGWLVMLLGAWAGAPGCGSAPPPPMKTPVSELSGQIEAIRMENINKARGHYTYTVELDVHVASVKPRPDGWGARRDHPLAVRVGTVAWTTLPAAERASVAPSGPAQTLKPKTWRQWHVGDQVHLRVVFTSPDLALLQRDE